MWGAIASAAGKVVDQGLDLYKNHAATSHADFWNSMNIALQKEFAQNSIKWRVEDAKRAGVHPMAALGISPASFSPVSTSIPYSPPTSYLADMGQNIDRAIQAGKDNEARADEDNYTKKVNILNLEKAGLENDLLRAQIDSLKAVRATAATPSAPPTNPSKVSPYGSPTPAKTPINNNSFTDGVSPLLGLSRVGNTLMAHINPDISDALTEDIVRNQLANMNAEFQSGRITPEVYDHLTQAERELIKKGDLVLEYEFPSTWRIRYSEKMRPHYSADKKSVSGKLNSYHMKY